MIINSQFLIVRPDYFTTIIIREIVLCSTNVNYVCTDYRNNIMTACPF